jgi:hypothetical protein
MGLTRRSGFASVTLFLLVLGCATSPRIDRWLEAPGRAALGEMSVAAEIGDGAVVIRLENSSATSKDVRIRVPQTVIGTRTVTERRQTGTSFEQVCDGDLCRMVEVPVYENVSVTSDVYGFFDIEPETLTLPPGGGATARISMRNPEAMTHEFTLTVAIVAQDAAGAETLGITAGSAGLLR